MSFVYLSPSLPLSLSLSLSLARSSLPHSLASRFLSLSHTHTTHTASLSHTYTHFHSHTHTFSLSFSLSLSHTHTHTHAHTHTQRDSLTPAPPRSVGAAGPARAEAVAGRHPASFHQLHPFFGCVISKAPWSKGHEDGAHTPFPGHPGAWPGSWGWSVPPHRGWSGSAVQEAAKDATIQKARDVRRHPRPPKGMSGGGMQAAPLGLGYQTLPNGGEGQRCAHCCVRFFA